MAPISLAPHMCTSLGVLPSDPILTKHLHTQYEDTPDSCLSWERDTFVYKSYSRVCVLQDKVLLGELAADVEKAKHTTHKSEKRESERAGAVEQTQRSRDLCWCASIRNRRNRGGVNRRCTNLRSLRKKTDLMSLFKAREWWTTTCGHEEFHDLGSLCIGNLDNSTPPSSQSCKLHTTHCCCSCSS